MRRGAVVPGKAVISIVDDDVSAREGVTDLIRTLGFAAQAFASAEDFLNSAQLESTRCLIVDMQMPGMTGLELHDRLVDSGVAIPTLLITAYPDERIRVRAHESGVAYLVKPVAEDDLLSCIRSALGHGWPAGSDG